MWHVVVGHQKHVKPVQQWLHFKKFAKVTVQCITFFSLQITPFFTFLDEKKEYRQTTKFVSHWIECCEYKCNWLIIITTNVCISHFKMAHLSSLQKKKMMLLQGRGRLLQGQVRGQVQEKSSDRQAANYQCIDTQASRQDKARQVQLKSGDELVLPEQFASKNLLPCNVMYCRPPAAGQSHWYLTLIKAPPPPTPPQPHTPHTPHSHWPPVSPEPPTLCNPCLLHPHADSCKRSMVGRKRQRSHLDASKTRPSPFLTHDEVLRWGPYLYTPSRTREDSKPLLYPTPLCKAPVHSWKCRFPIWAGGSVRCRAAAESVSGRSISIPQTGCSTAFFPAGPGLATSLPAEHSHPRTTQSTSLPFAQRCVNPGPRADLWSSVRFFITAFRAEVLQGHAAFS